MSALPAKLSDDWTGLLRLLGDHALMLHSPEPGSDLSGTDYDCAVLRLDRTWPLRITGEWSLCQCVHYDLLAWYWVLERDGEIFALDTVIDPQGLGRDGFPTNLFVQGDELAATPAVRAAYLTSKRVRKQMSDPREWQRIATLAGDSRSEYHDALRAVLGSRLSLLVGTAAFSGQPPRDDVLRRAHRLQRIRRVRSPLRLFESLALGTRRTIERVLHPTGLVVLIAGPDGAGKSTLAALLPEECSGLFRRNVHSHWRPGLLPRPGALMGREGPDSTQPHAREPHDRITSSLLLTYFWLDFLIGGWGRFAIPRVRSGLVVVERGWRDIEADPRRYRLDVSPEFVRTLGKLLPRPDVALILDGDPQTLLRRKDELAREDMDRQLEFWRHAKVGKLANACLDVESSTAEIASTARRVIVSTLEQQTASRLGFGWVNVPGRRNTRWYLPRGRRRVASSALSIFQPLTPRARVAWKAAHTGARIGGFRFLPRGDAPPREVRQAVAKFIPSRGNVAVSRMNHPGRYVAAVLDRDAKICLIVKIATDEAGTRSLHNEAQAIEDIAARLPEPLSVPKVVAHEPGLIAFEFVPWVWREDPSELPTEVAFALGQFFRVHESGEVGAAHGDFAPWNLLRTTAGWTLVDWEEATLRAEPFTDICHFYVQSHILLGGPSEQAIIDGFRRLDGGVGDAITAYAEGAKLDAGTAITALEKYLATSSESLLPTDREIGERARERLLRRLRA